MVDLPKPMRPDFRGSPVTFLKEVRSELVKVVWPSRQEVIKLTIIVIVISTALGLYIGSLDLIFTKVTDLFVNR